MLPSLYRHPHRNRCHAHRSVIILMVTVTLIVGGVVGDYPSPSEGGRGFYSRGNRGDGVRPLVGGEGGGDGYMSDWNRDWGGLGNPNPGKCINIPANLTLCGNIGYDRMRIPNLLEHDTLREVSQQASSWVRLLSVRCHPDTQVFLCSLFAPVCLERPIWPCRSLCESVKAGCEDRMLKYGFPWPDMLRCNRFPADDDLCIGLRNGNSEDGEETCSACLSDTFESTVDHYCRAEFVMRVKVKQATVTGTDLKVEAEKKKVFKAGSLKSNELREFSLFVGNGSSCDCPALDGGGGGTGKGKNSSNFVVMGNRVDDRLVLSFVHRIDQRSKEINRALRVARKPDTCTKSVLLDPKSGPHGGSSESKKAGGAKTGKKKGAKGKKSPHGKEGRVKGTSSTTTHEWKPTTMKVGTTTATATATRRKSQQPGRANNKKENKKKSDPTNPQQLY